MSDSTRPTDCTAGNTYDAALHDLADALVGVWSACEAAYDKDRDRFVGGNLPEAISCALGLAAVALRLDCDADGNVIDGDGAREVAAEALVRHRPGSWEAAHVRALVFSPDLIAHGD